MPDGTSNDVDGPSGIVLVSFEDNSSTTIRPRLEQAGADLDRIITLAGIVEGWAATEVEGENPETVYRPPTLADLGALRKAVWDVQASLVIVDPLMAALPPDVDAYRDAQVRRLLAPLTRLAQQEGVAIVVVRHLSKSSNGKALYRGGGSIGIAAAARSVLLVGADPDDPEGRRVLTRVKCNLAPPVPSLGFRVTSDGSGQPRVEWLGETRHTAETLLGSTGDEVERGALGEAVEFLQELLADGPISAEVVLKLARQTGIAESTLKRAKRKLSVVSQKKGFGTAACWYWTLPDHDQMAEEGQVAAL